MANKCPTCHSVNPDSQQFCGTCGSRLPGSDGQPYSPTLSLDVEGKALLPGSLFAGKYTIEGEIGRGGMGIVFKAQDTQLRRAVALKFLPAELSVRPEAKERFLREARAAAALDHPHICTIHEVGEATGLAYIAMGYVEGRTLSARIGQGALPPDEALDIALQVADGLAEAHRKGVFHRDIKSSNIMLTDKGLAKIMDFGLAKVAGDTVLTRESRTMGTISYMSPEQARGEEVDQRTDVWSLGVVIYEMLTARLPFQGGHEQAVIHGILHENPKPIKKLSPDVPESLANVVVKSLTKDRDKRYASAEELLVDLKRVKDGLVVGAPHLGLFSGRRKYALTAAAGILVVVAAAILLLTSKGSAKVYDTIAGMPFVMSGGDPGQEDISDGLTDEVIKRLYQVAALRVKATSTVLPYKNSQKRAAEIGRELKVKALVQARIYRKSGRIRIPVELVDTETETVLWTNSYEGDMGDVIALQASLAQDVTRNVRVRLTTAEQARLVKSQKVSPEAYERFLKAVQLSVNEPGSPVALERGLVLAREAIAIDPNFMQIYSLMLDIYGNQWYSNFRSFKDFIGPTTDIIKTILRIDPDSADAYGARAQEYNFAYRWRDALEARRKAVQLAPGDNLLRLRYATELGILGYTQQAIEEYSRIRANDPGFQSDSSNLIVIYFFGRRFDEAIALILEYLKTDPKSISSWWNLSWAYSHKNMHNEALDAVNKAVENMKAEGFPVSINLKINESIYLASAGEREKALAIMHELERSPEKEILGTFFDYCMACALAQTRDPRDREAAFRYLETSTAEFHQSSTDYGTESFLDPLRSDPRFAQIVKKVGFPIE